uniref:Uncharacterized protein n=1 Tax=Trichogramma kaykai TaxID=54128 RepID=A0ABD2XNV3_9HYME
MNYICRDRVNEGELIIKFVARSGYEDEPEVDEDGKPLLQCTTAVHHTLGCMPCYRKPAISELFKIYECRLDANYSDESGVTHFHVACMLGCDDVVEKFLELGQDPNCLVPETGNSSLHWALKHERKKVVELLLRSGANTNLADVDGLTPLHVACLKDYDQSVFFFKINDEMKQIVQVDEKDEMGWTPLEWAVSHILPGVVGVLMNHGADPSKFDFPSEIEFTTILEDYRNVYEGNFKLRLCSVLLAIIERLEKKGYKMNRSDALMIMKLFFKYRLFEKSANLEKCWYENRNFARKAKNIMIRDNDPELSLYDLIRLRPDEAEKLFTVMDYFQFADSIRQWSKGPSGACVAHLCEKVSRRFFQHWALRFFFELSCSALSLHEISIISCEIMEELTNKKLYNICLAANIQKS